MVVVLFFLYFLYGLAACSLLVWQKMLRDEKKRERNRNEYRHELHNRFVDTQHFTLFKYDHVEKTPIAHLISLYMVTKLPREPTLMLILCWNCYELKQSLIVNPSQINTRHTNVRIGLAWISSLLTLFLNHYFSLPFFLFLSCLLALFYGIGEWQFEMVVFFSRTPIIV